MQGGRGDINEGQTLDHLCKYMFETIQKSKIQQNVKYSDHLVKSIF